jgi:hypothetical protein
MELTFMQICVQFQHDFVTSKKDKLSCSTLYSRPCTVLLIKIIINKNNKNINKKMKMPNNVMYVLGLLVEGCCLGPLNIKLLALT